LETNQTKETLLINLLKDHSKEGFDKLYKAYANSLFIIIHKIVGDQMIAEDLLQETFVKIWKNIAQYDSNKGRLYTWILNIARNASLDYLKSSQNKFQKMMKGNEDFASYLPDSSTVINTDYIGLDTLVIKLEPKYHEVLDTIFFKGYTYEEAAEKLQIPIGTLKTRARTALQLLRTQVS
jgi:RNA polymerase sigma-70 factor (ECF subfamily)